MGFTGRPHQAVLAASSLVRGLTTSQERVTEANGWQGWKELTFKRAFKLPWREAGPSNHLDDTVDSDQ